MYVCFDRWVFLWHEQNHPKEEKQHLNLFYFRLNMKKKSIILPWRLSDKSLITLSVNCAQPIRECELGKWGLKWQKNVDNEKVLNWTYSTVKAAFNKSTPELAHFSINKINRNELKELILFFT